MTALQIIFLFVGAMTLASAVMVVSARRIMHAALWLVLTLAGVAIIFALLDAGFFAIVQVLVYIGAIAILIIFAIMLTRKGFEDVGPQANRGWWLAALAAVGVFAGLAVIIVSWPGVSAMAGAGPDANVIVNFGKDLVDPNKYVMPFEVASVMLLAALIGAIYASVEGKGGQK
jgi:NADH-quinone oxidoreductase subunit J